MTTVTHLRRRLALVVRDDVVDRGAAMMSALLLIMMLSAMGILVLGLVVSQVTPTQLARRTTATQTAAEAGLDAALGQLRTATTANGKGDPARLPCGVSGVASGATLSYDVSVAYYRTDPTPQPKTWRDSPVNRIPCSAGTGLSEVPSFALLTSKGSAGAAGRFSTTAGSRTLESLYTFSLSSVNIPGGLFWSISEKYCLSAVSAAAGATVRYVPAAGCLSGAPLQMWKWEDDYTIQLVSTTLTKESTPLCMTRLSPSSANPLLVTLQPCSARADQYWSYEGGAKFNAQNDANTNYANRCLGAGPTGKGVATDGSTTGVDVYASSTACSSNNDEWGSFSPEPRVGAGAASAKTVQIVNYLEFGRCFDVTNGNVSSSYMIIYPCKQDPSGGGKLNWNHKWYYGAAASQPDHIEVLRDNTTRYCLQTPSATASPAYVTLTQACSTTAQAQSFVRTEESSNTALAYTIRDSLGRCLGVGPKQSPAAGTYWSTIVAGTCTGSPDQKWNAPSNAVPAAVTQTRELTTPNG